MHIIFTFTLLLGTNLLLDVQAVPINHDCEDAEECGNLILLQRIQEPYHPLPVPTPPIITGGINGSGKQLGGPIHAISSLKGRELSEDDDTIEDCKRSANDASSEPIYRRCGGGDGGDSGGGSDGGSGSDDGNNDNGPPDNPSNPDTGDEGEYGGMDADQLIAAADAAAPSDPSFWQNHAFCYAWLAVFGSLLDGTCDFLRPLPPSGGGGGGGSAPAPAPPASGGKKSIGRVGGRPQRRGGEIADLRSLEWEKV